MKKCKELIDVDGTSSQKECGEKIPWYKRRCWDCEDYKQYVISTHGEHINLTNVVSWKLGHFKNDLTWKLIVWNDNSGGKTYYIAEEVYKELGWV